MIDAEEKRVKAEEIMRQEGTYLTYLKWKKRGAWSKVEAMIEDVINRHGQNFDGDLEFKHKDSEEVKI